MLDTDLFYAYWQDLVAIHSPQNAEVKMRIYYEKLKHLSNERFSVVADLALEQDFLPKPGWFKEQANLIAQQERTKGLPALPSAEVEVTGAPRFVHLGIELYRNAVARQTAIFNAAYAQAQSSLKQRSPNTPAAVIAALAMEDASVKAAYRDLLKLEGKTSLHSWEADLFKPWYEKPIADFYEQAKAILAEQGKDAQAQGDAKPLELVVEYSYSTTVNDDDCEDF